MPEQALKIASHITNPVSVAAFAAALALIAFCIAIRAKKLRVAWLLATGILIPGLAPLASSTFLESRGLYRVRISVLGIDKQPVNDALVISSIGGEPKKVEGGWEFDIPPQTRPADGKVILFASMKNAFLTGSSTLVLGRDYYPTATIQLATDTSAVLRGIVVDEHRRSVAGAQVSIPGYPDVAVTDNLGNFVLPAHAADGQIVHVRAQKAELAGTLSVPAGQSVEVIVKRP